MKANSTKVLVWKSFGHVSLYALDNELQYRKAFNDLTECAMVGGFEYQGSQDINELIHWINSEVADDWELFEYLQIEAVKV